MLLMIRTFYDVLGVSQTASHDEVKKAFKKLASETHPDVNPGNASAEQKFKELNEAYQMLSDQDKRKVYDFNLQNRQVSHHSYQQYGNVNQNIWQEIFRESMQDIFARNFRVQTNVNADQNIKQKRGSDLTVSVILTLEDAVVGCKRKIHVKAPNPTSKCGVCSGSGAEPGIPKIPCNNCGGFGKVTTYVGVMRSSECYTCHGTGQIAITKCTACRGLGEVAHESEVTVTIPPGINSGQCLRVSGQGTPGSPNGDLYVEITVREHEFFKRNGSDLFIKLNVPFRTALCGGTCFVDMLDGVHQELKIPPMSISGKTLTFSGLGVQDPIQKITGSLHAQVEVMTPKNLSLRAQKLLDELGEELTS